MLHETYTVTHGQTDAVIHENIATLAEAMRFAACAVVATGAQIGELDVNINVIETDEDGAEEFATLLNCRYKRASRSIEWSRYSYLQRKWVPHVVGTDPRFPTVEDKACSAARLAKAMTVLCPAGSEGVVQ